MSWYKGAEIVKLSAQSSPQPELAELESEHVYCSSVQVVDD